MTGSSLTQETAPATGLRLQARGAAAALQFLTVYPALVRSRFAEQELGASVGYFPLAGLLLGLSLAAFGWVARAIFPLPVACVLVIGVWELFTGALHLDGFLDSCDGLFGGRTLEDRLRILRDHHVGAYAVAGGVTILLLRYSALLAAGLPLTGLVLAAVCGRWAISLSLVALPYARPDGLGRAMKDHAGPAQAAVATVTAVAALVALSGVTGLIALALGAVTAAAWAAVVMRRLPGMTGDTYGATCVLVETSVLLLLSARLWA
ncbi:MAG: adenosylcobinamide-GDP ribazoletransferase [Anaerolineae bacterium]|nr:adenosylcobinamide-GDP ribazoletransferase [Anaerolineae bacterium]